MTNPRSPRRTSTRKSGPTVRTATGGLPPAPPPPPEALPLPHERDESGGHTASRPDPLMRQARSDIDRGLVDTDLRSTPGLDAARRKALVSGTDTQVLPADPSASRRSRR